MSASVAPLLMTNKPPKNGEYPIYLRITMHRKPRYISIGVRCSVELWDEQKGQPKPKHPLYQHIIMLIGEKIKKAQRDMIDAEVGGVAVSSKDIKDSLRPKAPKTANIIEFIDQLIEGFYSDKRIGNAKIYKSLQNSLVTFYGSDKLMFNNINLDFIWRYERSFIERGVKPNSAFLFLRTLKTCINHAKKRGLVDKDFTPFADFSFLKYRKIKTKKRKIAKEDIMKIGMLKVEPNTWMHHAQNLFMFSYYNFGINFIDMAHLKWSNIQDGRLIYVRKKTGDDFKFKINDPSMKILDFYRENPHPDADGYIFPILSAVHKNEISQDNRTRKVITIVNKNLKIIAAMCGINEHLTTYVARHSFANVLKQSNVPTSVISEMMGHETEKVTKVYLDSFGDDTIDQAANFLL